PTSRFGLRPKRWMPCPGSPRPPPPPAGRPQTPRLCPKAGACRLGARHGQPRPLPRTWPPPWGTPCPPGGSGCPVLTTWPATTTEPRRQQVRTSSQGGPVYTLPHTHMTVPTRDIDLVHVRGTQTAWSAILRYVLSNLGDVDHENGTTT